MDIHDRPLVKQKLLTAECFVQFEKADGSIRLMRCTNKPELIEAILGATEEKETKKEPNEFIQVVFDLDKEAWRTFVWSRLISVSFWASLDYE